MEEGWVIKFTMFFWDPHNFFYSLVLRVRPMGSEKPIEF